MSKRTRQKKTNKRRGPLLKRVAPAANRGASSMLSTPRTDGRRAAGPPEATIRTADGPVNVEIAFGHAQHGTYTVQLFDPTGKRELAAETGVSTDDRPDVFALALTPAELDRHLVQWSGAVDAF